MREAAPAAGGSALLGSQRRTQAAHGATAVPAAAGASGPGTGGAGAQGSPGCGSARASMAARPKWLTARGVSIGEVR